MTPRTLAFAAFLVLVGACAGWTLPIDPGEPDPPAEPLPEPPNPPRAPEPEIYLAARDGSIAGVLTAGSRPSWSPDGRKILLVRGAEIQLIDADDSVVTSLSPGKEPAWAPDGRRLAFVNGEGIAVMNADGSGIRILLSHRFRGDTYTPWDLGIGKPAWSPDGSRIAFGRTRQP